MASVSIDSYIDTNSKKELKKYVPDLPENITGVNTKDLSKVADKVKKGDILGATDVAVDLGIVAAATAAIPGIGALVGGLIVGVKHLLQALSVGGISGAEKYTRDNVKKPVENPSIIVKEFENRVKIFPELGKYADGSIFAKIAGPKNKKNDILWLYHGWFSDQIVKYQSNIAEKFGDRKSNQEFLKIASDVFLKIFPDEKSQLEKLIRVSNQIAERKPTREGGLYLNQVIWNWIPTEYWLKIQQNYDKEVNKIKKSTVKQLDNNIKLKTSVKFSKNDKYIKLSNVKKIKSTPKIKKVKAIIKKNNSKELSKVLSPEKIHNNLILMASLGVPSDYLDA